MKLSSQAITVLETLKSGSKTVEELENEGLDQSMVNRAALELEEKGLAKVEEEDELEHSLTETGETVIENGSPEHNLIERVSEGDSQLSELQDLNLDVALGKAREKNWIEIEGGVVALTSEGENALGTDEVRQRLKNEDYGEEDEDRGLVETTVRTTKTLTLTPEGEKLDLDEVEEDFNVEARAMTPVTGKKHFYKEVLQHARRSWLNMGFEEMSGDFVVSSFLNFDALYTPQDHPAREMQDTFFMSNPGSADLSEYGEKVDNVRAVHENGWDTGSKGWKYSWSEEEAAKNVLRTHTTAVSADTLHQIEVEERELPIKFFTVARNFRNETIDRHHLAEFLQTDGIVVGKDLNFRNLKAYIAEFFESMDYDDFRLIPSYYPYTEMSVEVQVYDERAEEYIGLGGAGMFRPEVVKPLLGFEATVLAWGLGLGRIAIIQAGLHDLRELYRNDIEVLEETPVWRPDR